MATQSYETHRHTPRLTGTGFFFLLIALVGFGMEWAGRGGRTATAIAFLGLVASNLVLLLISRAYTTALQDRIIKLEMRVRGAAVLNPSQQASLARLTKAQVIALRFASDEELPTLLERAERERLSGDQIKRAITHWVPDVDRT